MLSKLKSNIQSAFFLLFKKPIKPPSSIVFTFKNSELEFLRRSIQKPFQFNSRKIVKANKTNGFTINLKQLFQYFNGEQSFIPKKPCLPTELVEFSIRICRPDFERKFSH